MKDYAVSFYTGTHWRNTQRLYMLSRHYICERCGSLAKVVHHKEYITPQNINDVDVTLSWGNLEALCMACHQAEHKGSTATAEGISFSDCGEIIYTPQK